MNYDVKELETKMDVLINRRQHLATQPNLSRSDKLAISEMDDRIEWIENKIKSIKMAQKTEEEYGPQTA
jgi:hypothetical protein